MKRIRRLATISFLVGTLVFSPPQQSRAQYVVFDPANLAESILQVIHLIQSNINEAAMIANQIQSLEHEILNLTSLPFDIISQFKSRLESLFSTLGSIDGLMQHLSELEAKFDEAYPDFSTEFSPVPGVQVYEDMHQRVERTRNMIRGSLKTSADVLDKLPATEAELAKLMNKSQAAVGILQAAQSGNQIAASIAAQLMSLNAQLGSYVQAHTAQLMEWNGAQTATKNRMDHVLDDWAAPYTPNPVEDNPF